MLRIFGLKYKIQNHSPDTSSRELREQDHALDVVVLEKVNVGAHVSNGANIDHDHIIYLRELLFIEPTRQNHLCCSLLLCNRLHLFQ